MEFACKKINIEEVVRCSLGMKKPEFKLFNFMLEHNKRFTIIELSRKLSLNRTTVQKIIKKLVEKELVERYQENLSKGGYLFIYTIKNKQFLKEKIKFIIKKWYENVNNELERW